MDKNTNGKNSNGVSPAKNASVVVRVAPSPTGNLHVGTARAALFNYLFAKKLGGKFILRIEDTDRERSKKEYEGNIIEGLSWLGITWDEFCRQSERGPLYRKHLERLLKEGKARLTTPEEETRIAAGKGLEGKREGVIRLVNPGRSVTFTDAIRGDITFDTGELGDFVIAKSLDEPLYHFAVVVDDFEMGVTHVIRGEDHISNTPRQILIGEALGAPRPEYAHIPLILAKDRSKLSKRHGAVSLTEYRDRGYLPEAMVNYLALLGWNPGTPEELFSMDELVKLFDLSRVQKGGAVFDTDKLGWFNREYLKRDPKKLEDEIRLALRKAGLDGAFDPAKLFPLVSERVSFMSEVAELINDGDLSFLKGADYDAEKLSWKGESRDSAIVHLTHAAGLLGDIDAKRFSAEAVKEKLMPYADAKGRGSVLWPMRVALTGKDKSPDPFTVASILGKEETLKRLSAALDKLHDN